MALHQSSHTKGLCLHLAQSRSQPSRPFVRPVLRLLTRACGDCERAGRTRSTGLLAAPPHSAPASQRLARSSSRRSSAGGGPAPERQAELLPSAAAVSGDAKSSAGLGRRAEALDQLSCSGRQHSGQLLDGAVGGARGADPASEAGGHAESLSAAPAAHEPHACSGSGRGVTGGGGQSLDGAVEEVRGRSAAASKAGDFSGSLGVRAALAALYIYKGAWHMSREACQACADSRVCRHQYLYALHETKLPVACHLTSPFVCVCCSLLHMQE